MIESIKRWIRVRLLGSPERQLSAAMDAEVKYRYSCMAIVDAWFEKAKELPELEDKIAYSIRQWRIATGDYEEGK